MPRRIASARTRDARVPAGDDHASARSLPRAENASRPHPNVPRRRVPRDQPLRPHGLRTRHPRSVRRTTSARLAATPLVRAPRHSHRRASAEVRGDWPADHELHEVGFAQFGGGSRRHVAAVAQHGNRVAEAIDLRHSVRDVDARHAARFELRDQLVQSFGFELAQAARRLVEDDDAGAAADGHGDLNDLLLRDRQLAEPARDIQVRADRREHLLRASGDGAPVHEAARDG